MKVERELRLKDLPGFVASPEVARVVKNDPERYVRVTVSTPRRTTGKGSQSHHFNGHVQQIAMATFNDFADVKKYVKQRAVSMGYPLLERFGRPLLDPWGMVQGISETEATTSDMSLLIEAAHLVAAEEGVVLREE